MADIPVKKYRVRRARKWLKNKPDRAKFPPRSQSDVPGLARYESEAERLEFMKSMPCREV